MERKMIDSMYRQLKSRISRIKSNFDFTVGINGPTPLQNDKIRGMLLLCHAEFEFYIERIANSLVDDAVEKWRRTHRANYNLASLFVESEKIIKNESIEYKVSHIISDYKNLINHNHGIKEKNIKTLFKPLGYSLDQFDSIFIANLNSFGFDRGEVAHTSAISTTTIYDKYTVECKIDDILNGLSDFQEEILKHAN